MCLHLYAHLCTCVWGCVHTAVCPAPHLSHAPLCPGGRTHSSVWSACWRYSEEVGQRSYKGWQRPTRRASCAWQRGSDFTWTVVASLLGFWQGVVPGGCFRTRRLRPSLLQGWGMLGGHARRWRKSQQVRERGASRAGEPLSAPCPSATSPQQPSASPGDHLGVHFGTRARSPGSHTPLRAFRVLRIWKAEQLATWWRLW